MISKHVERSPERGFCAQIRNRSFTRRVFETEKRLHYFKALIITLFLLFWNRSTPLANAIFFLLLISTFGISVYKRVWISVTKISFYNEDVTIEYSRGNNQCFAKTDRRLLIIDAKVRSVSLLSMEYYLKLKIRNGPNLVIYDHQLPYPNMFDLWVYCNPDLEATWQGRNRIKAFRKFIEKNWL